MIETKARFSGRQIQPFRFTDYVLINTSDPSSELLGYFRSSVLRTQAPAALTSFAFKLISVPARACDTGQFFLADSACSRKVFSSMPGTSPSVLSSIVVILKPSPTFSSLTLALVLIRVGLKPPFVSPAARAIEKHPACAAPISSSGLVPVPSSNLEAKEY